MWQTDTTWTPPFSSSMFWIKKKKQKLSNLRLVVSRGKYKVEVCMCEC